MGLGDVQVRNLDNDTVASIAHGVPARVLLNCQFPARPARWSSTLSRSDAEFILRNSGAVAGLGVVAASSGGDIAVATVVLISRAVFGEGGFVALG